MRGTEELLLGMQVGAATVENRMEATEKTKNRVTRSSTKPTSECMFVFFIQAP